MQKIGIVLSGGGARGFAHIGILQALQEADIYPEVVAGTSIGAIMGSMYAAGKTPEEMMEFSRKAVSFRSIRLAAPWYSLFSLLPFERKLRTFLGVEKFEDLKLPFAVTASNMESGELEFVDSGDLAKAVIASSSVPGVFKPVDLNGALYLDGGVMMNLPAEIIRDKVDFLIGVNVHPKVPITRKKVKNIFGIGLRNFDLVLHGNMRESQKLCDFVFAPAAIVKYHIFQFWKYKEIYQIGYEEGKRVIEDLKKKI